MRWGGLPQIDRARESLIRNVKERKGKKKDAILRTKEGKEKALSIVRSYDGGSKGRER